MWPPSRVIGVADGIHYDGGDGTNGLFFVGDGAVAEDTRGPTGPDQSGFSYITRAFRSRFVDRSDEHLVDHVPARYGVVHSVLCLHVALLSLKGRVRCQRPLQNLARRLDVLLLLPSLALEAVPQRAPDVSRAAPGAGLHLV